MYPDTHPNTAVPIFKEKGYDDEFIEAVLGHAYPERTDVPRTSLMAKHLFACDEITGFIIAYSYMKPGGIDEVEPKGVIKKMKDKAFAKNVNRDDIRLGAEEIGIELNEHLQNIITAMREDNRLK
jgi:predicted hydrolase (HD superfamily)